MKTESNSKQDVSVSASVGEDGDFGDLPDDPRRPPVTRPITPGDQAGSGQICPECGGFVIPESGCFVCMSCGCSGCG